MEHWRPLAKVFCLVLHCIALHKYCFFWITKVVLWIHLTDCVLFFRWLEFGLKQSFSSHHLFAYSWKQLVRKNLEYPMALQSTFITIDSTRRCSHRSSCWRFSFASILNLGRDLLQYVDLFTQRIDFLNSVCLRGAWYTFATQLSIDHQVNEICFKLRQNETKTVPQLLPNFENEPLIVWRVTNTSRSDDEFKLFQNGTWRVPLLGGRNLFTAPLH